MKKRIQVFISSTYTDLLKERQAAVSAILKAGHIPAGMELFAAGDESQLRTIRRWIDESDVFMLILGCRYGSIEPKTGKSYVELEYDYAVGHKKPFFAVVIAEKTLEQRVRRLRKSASPGYEDFENYQRFREKVLSRTSSFFKDSKDVKLAVHEALSDLQGKHELSGWIAASEVQPLGEKVKRLEEELRRYRSESESPGTKPGGHKRASTDNEEMRELVDVLRGVEIDATRLKAALKASQTKVNIPDSISLLDAFVTFRDTLTTGVTGRKGIGVMFKYLYFDVCPRLQTHGLVQNEPVAGQVYRRSGVTEKGLRLLAHIDKTNVRARQEPSGL